MKNKIRTSQSMATVASHTLAGRLDDAFVEMLVRNLLSGIDEHKALIEQLAASLAGSALANRRA